MIPTYVFVNYIVTKTLIFLRTAKRSQRLENKINKLFSQPSLNLNQNLTNVFRFTLSQIFVMLMLIVIGIYDLTTTIPTTLHCYLYRCLNLLDKRLIKYKS